MASAQMMFAIGVLPACVGKCRIVRGDLGVRCPAHGLVGFLWGRP